MKDNLDFVCDICGRYRGDGDDCPSIVTMEAGYGSKQFDGSRLTLKLCGDCIDWMMSSVPEESGTWEREVPW